MPTAAPSRDMPRLMVRLPNDVKKWLAQQARRNASSQTSEIVRSLRERMDRETATSVARTTGQAA
jgi:predicted transcriptional regulator